VSGVRVLDEEIDVAFVKFNNLIPYPGTPVYDDAQKRGKMHIAPD
jgi:biotin synthase-like enzyme